MAKFEPGDRVRVDIPDTRDPDFERFHGQYGTVEDVITDDAGQETGDSRDSYLYIVALEEGETHGFRWRDLRPAPEE